jgi:hypothetical protein
VGVILGALAGWVLGTPFASPNHRGEAPEFDTEQHATPTASSSEFLRKADAILSEPSAFQRRIQLIDLVRHARPSILRRLLQKFPHDRVARRLIASQ